jgi:hypothetical protein
VSDIKTDCSACTRLKHVTVPTLPPTRGLMLEATCGLGLHDKYEAAGDTVAPGPVVEGRVCPYFTTAEPPGDPAAVREAMRLRYLAVVWFDPSDCDALGVTLAALAGAALPPAAVEVVLPAGWPAWTRGAADRCRLALPATPWNVLTVTARERDAGIDAAVAGRSPGEFPYYVVTDAGSVPREDMAARFDRLLNDGMRRVICLTGSPTFGRGPLVHTLTHHALGGNAPAFHDVRDPESGEVTESIRCDSIVDKVKILAAAQGKPDLVRPMDSLWEVGSDE